jgi:hypothetical protein
VWPGAELKSDSRFNFGIPSPSPSPFSVPWHFPGGDVLRGVYHFVYHDLRQLPLRSVSTLLEPKQNPLIRRALAGDSW